MKFVIPSHFISWKKPSNDAVTPQRQSQFTPKMKANAVPRLLLSLVWIDQYCECNGMTSFTEFMVCMFWSLSLWIVYGPFHDPFVIFFLIGQNQWINVIRKSRLSVVIQHDRDTKPMQFWHTKFPLFLTINICSKPQKNKNPLSVPKCQRVTFTS